MSTPPRRRATSAPGNRAASSTPRRPSGRVRSSSTSRPARCGSRRPGRRQRRRRPARTSPTSVRVASCCSFGSRTAEPAAPAHRHERRSPPTRRASSCLGVEADPERVEGLAGSRRGDPRCGPPGPARGGPSRRPASAAARAGTGSAARSRAGAAGDPRRGRRMKSRTTPRGPAAGPDAQPRVAERVGHAAAHRLAERDREPRGRVDRAAPAVREARGRRAAGTPGRTAPRACSKVCRSLVELRRDPAAEVVDRVVAAPQDPVVGGEPEVVELVVRVGQALAPRPADRLPLRRASAAPTPARSRRPARTAARAGAASRSRPTSRRRPGRPGRVAPPAVATVTPPARRSSPVDAGALVDRHAALARDAGEAPAQLRRVDQDVPPGRPVQAGVPERGVDLGPGRVAVQELEVLAVLGRLVDPGPELVDLVRLVGQGERAGLLEVAVDAVRRG